jgi:hypothetical protein
MTIDRSVADRIEAGQAVARLAIADFVCTRRTEAEMTWREALPFGCFGHGRSCKAKRVASKKTWVFCIDKFHCQSY